MRRSKKDLIAETALKLFADGYTTTPISLIAKTAMISQGLLYNFFSSKEDLLHHILQQGKEDVLEVLQPFELEKDQRKALQQYVILVFRKIKENHDFWKLFFTI